MVPSDPPETKTIAAAVATRLRLAMMDHPPADNSQALGTSFCRGNSGTGLPAMLVGVAVD
jgi:hypothetical protein